MAEKESIQTEEVNIEEIMQQIRRQILEKKAARAVDGTVPVRLGGNRFSPELYDRLYRAGMGYDRVQIPVLVSKSSIPVIGWFMQLLRRKVHELVVFYINQHAAKQIGVNTHLLKALSMLVEELESLPPSEEGEEEAEATS